MFGQKATKAAKEEWGLRSHSSNSWKLETYSDLGQVILAQSGAVQLGGATWRGLRAQRVAIFTEIVTSRRKNKHVPPAPSQT